MGLPLQARALATLGTNPPAPELLVDQSLRHASTLLWFHCVALDFWRCLRRPPDSLPHYGLCLRDPMQTYTPTPPLTHDAHLHPSPYFPSRRIQALIDFYRTSIDMELQQRAVECGAARLLRIHA